MMEVENNGVAGEVRALRPGIVEEFSTRLLSTCESTKRWFYIVIGGLLAYLAMKFVIWACTTAFSCGTTWGFLYLVNKAAEAWIEFNEDYSQSQAARERNIRILAQSLAGHEAEESAEVRRRARTVPAIRFSRTNTWVNENEDNEEMEQFETPSASQESSLTTLTRMVRSRARSMPAKRTKTNFTVSDERSTKFDFSFD